MPGKKIKLEDPFKIEQLHVRVGNTNSDKSSGLALVYVDARDVMDRLDQVPGDWQDTYVNEGTGKDKFGKHYISFRCSLTIQGVTHEDVGQGSEHKDAVSDALKRAAVKFKVARYLYDTPNQWFKLTDKGRFEAPEEKIIERLMGMLEAQNK